MAGHIKIKTALLRLGRGSVEELAIAAGVLPPSVKSFLHKHPDLVATDDPAGTVRLGGRGRPPRVWKLRPEAYERLASEIASLGIEERPAPSSIEQSVLKLLAGLEAAEKLLRSGSAAARSDLKSLADELDFRLRTTEAAVRDADGSAATGRMTELALRQIKLSVAKLRADMQRAAGRTVEDLVEEFFAAWFTRLEGAVSRHVSLENLRRSGNSDFLPVLIIDGTPGSGRGLANHIFRTGMGGSHAMRVPVGGVPQSEREGLFVILAEQMKSAAGAATQVFYTFDSGTPDAETMLKGFVTIDNARATAPATLESWDEASETLLGLSGALFERAGLSFAGDPASERLPSAGWLAAACMFDQLANIGGNRVTRRVRSVCVDVSDISARNHFLAGTRLLKKAHIDYARMTKFVQHGYNVPDIIHDFE